MRKRLFRFLNLPFFIAGIFYWHIKDAFTTGYEWEKIEMDKVK
jgi:hypothetical protein